MNISQTTVELLPLIFCLGCFGTVSACAFFLAIAIMKDLKRNNQ